MCPRHCRVAAPCCSALPRSGLLLAPRSGSCTVSRRQSMTLCLSHLFAAPTHTSRQRKPRYARHVRYVQCYFILQLLVLQSSRHFEPCCIHAPRPFDLLLIDCCSCTLFVLPDATSLLSRVYAGQCMPQAMSEGKCENKLANEVRHICI